MKEHDGPGEATIIVLSGRTLSSAGSTNREGRKGDLLGVPAERHSLEALMDTVCRTHHRLGALTNSAPDRVGGPCVGAVWPAPTRPSAAATMHSHPSTEPRGETRNLPRTEGVCLR